ncbi:hypothetical protein [Thiospirillum jenense]|uniref:Type II secretion system protein GspF domain-containing protein n=1 Tax=Thiospirillum jenense TaxID=1653858 RepID=A0A839HGZ6_9GAMM|nr:hypothetical protein [Thiospirillum jenense]MBB1126358.1 hypothetical protein [Thiospirillum jenense]
MNDNAHTQSRLARQSYYLAQAGVNETDADQRLAHLFGITAVNQFRQSAEHDKAAQALGPVFNSMATRSAELKLNSILITTALGMLRRELAILYNPAVRIFRKNLEIVTATTTVATAMLLFFMYIILPQFVDVYSGFGVDLPRLTTIMFNHNMLYFLIVFVWSLVALFLVLNRWLNQLIQLNQRPHKRFHLIPIVGHWVTQFESDLFLRCYLTIRSLGATGEQTQAIVLHGLGYTNLNETSALLCDLAESLTIATQLNTEADESHYWQLALQSNSYLERRYQLLAYSLFVLLGFAIACFIIAIYLPIFKLASVV